MSIKSLVYKKYPGLMTIKTSVLEVQKAHERGTNDVKALSDALKDFLQIHETHIAPNNSCDQQKLQNEIHERNERNERSKFALLEICDLTYDLHQDVMEIAIQELHKQQVIQTPEDYRRAVSYVLYHRCYANDIKSHESKFKYLLNVLQEIHLGMDSMYPMDPENQERKIKILVLDNIFVLYSIWNPITNRTETKVTDQALGHIYSLNLNNESPDEFLYEQNEIISFLYE